MKKLDYVKSIQIPDISEEQKIRFMAVSQNDAEGNPLTGDAVYMRKVSDDPLVLGDIIEVATREELLELITELINGEADEDYPAELTVENINDLAVNLLQTTYQINVNIGYDLNVAEKVALDAGYTGDKAIVVDAVKPADPGAEATEGGDAAATTSEEELY